MTGKNWLIGYLALFAFELCAQTVDEVFEKASRATNKNQTNIGASVFEDLAKAQGDLQVKVNAGDDKAQARREWLQGPERRTADKSQSSNSSKTTSAAERSAAVQPLISFSCVIYCNSASGPKITREIQAAGRAAAAKSAGDQANSFCKGSGYVAASSLTLPESQCRRN